MYILYIEKSMYVGKIWIYLGGIVSIILDELGFYGFCGGWLVGWWFWWRGGCGCFDDEAMDGNLFRSSFFSSLLCSLDLIRLIWFGLFRVIFSFSLVSKGRKREGWFSFAMVIFWSVVGPWWVVIFFLVFVGGRCDEHELWAECFHIWFLFDWLG